MQRLSGLLVAVIGLACSAATASAQTDLFAMEEPPTPPAASTVTLPSSGPVTPEMWLYMQEYQRYQQPKEAVRRKAEIRASQRQRRLEAQRWFGMSNLRPMVNPIPYYGSYSPAWVGHSSEPFSWIGYGQPFVTYHTTSRTTR
jgi:hypothetical protein